MRCDICDAELSEAEIQQTSDDVKHAFEPCRKCQEIILDAAFSGVFAPNRIDLSEPSDPLEFIDEKNNP